MKVIIDGSRGVTDYKLIKDTIKHFIKEHDIYITEVVSGCARGADRLGEQYAKKNKIPIKYFPADWKKCGRPAGPIRNQQMADRGEALVAFWKNNSRGTADMIKRASDNGLKVLVKTIEDDDDTFDGVS